MPGKIKKVFLVRHGESAGSRNTKRHSNYTELSERGRDQANAAGLFLKGRVDVLTIWCSTLIRAKITAQIIADKMVDRGSLGVSASHYFDEIKKPSRVNGASWQEDFHKKYMAQREAAIRRADPDWSFEDGSSFGDYVEDQIVTAINQIETQGSDEMVIVSHSNFICLFRAVAKLGIDASWKEIFREFNSFRIGYGEILVAYYNTETSQWWFDR